MTDKDTQALLERLRELAPSLAPRLPRSCSDDVLAAADTIEALTRERAVKDEGLKVLRLFADYKPELQTRSVMDNLQREARRVLAALTANKPLMDGEV